MEKIYEKLAYSLKWITFESVTYQILFLIHQIVLFFVSKGKLYGIIGATFSLIYFTVTIASFGLESSLSPFFKKISDSQNRFRRFFSIQILPTFAFTIVAAMVFVFIVPSSYTFIILISLIVLSESIKKTLRGALYLAFKNQTNAYVEIASILAYITSIWSCYLFTKKITLHLIFVPMLLTSVISTAILFLFLYKFYKTMPAHTNKANIPLARVAKCRTINFINQFTHNMFSGNFLTPFFAFQFGLTQAGTFKLMSHISYGVTSLMRKIFGWASDTILAQTKDTGLQEKKAAFSAITAKLHNVVYAIIIFLTINLTKIVRCSHTGNSATNWQLIIFFLIITLSENLFITYEKFYITEEKNFYILLCNLLSIAFLTVIISFSSYFPQLTLLILIASSRIGLFAILSLFSYHKWTIKPNLQINPLYIASSISASIAVFIVLQKLHI